MFNVIKDILISENKFNKTNYEILKKHWFILVYI